jgi:hypothetical protein
MTEFRRIPVRAARPSPIFLVLLPCLIAGCGPSGEEKLLPVWGTVKVEDQPLTAGWVTFYPDEARGNRSTRLPLAEIKPDGTYRLSTNGRPGATAGVYKVVVAASQDPIPLKPRRNPDGSPWKPRWLIHEKYTRPDTTDQRIEVVENASPGRYDLELSR